MDKILSRQDMQKKVDALESGKYKLKTIFNEEWCSITPKVFGKFFKNKVKEGLIKNIIIGEKDSDNAQFYIK